MITEFLRNDIGIITYSTIYVQHITFIIILRFHTYKRFDSIPEFLKNLFWSIAFLLKIF